MMISGSWWYGRFAEEITGFQWGTFLFPGNKLHPGSSGNLWVVPAARRPGTFTARVANPGAASTVQTRRVCGRHRPRPPRHLNPPLSVHAGAPG